MAEKVGFRSIQKTLPADTSEETLISVVRDLNADPAVNGILVQLPLPSHINETKVTELIDPAKDVDGFHPSMSAAWAPVLLSRRLFLAPLPVLFCSPSKRSAMIYPASIPSLSGVRTLSANQRRNLFLKENCTVTIAHSRTKDLADVVRQADIVVAAVGRPEMIPGEWIKSGATVIDVGINRVPAPERGEGKSKLGRRCRLSKRQRNGRRDHARSRRRRPDDHRHADDEYADSRLPPEQHCASSVGAAVTDRSRQGRDILSPDNHRGRILSLRGPGQILLPRRTAPASLEIIPVLTPTMPYSSASLIRQTRPISRV